MTRFSSKNLCVCVGLALTVLAVVFFAWPPLSPTTKPGIFVLGRTNDPATGPSVLFSLTNQSDARMTFFVDRPQFKTAGWWSPPPGLRGILTDLPSHQSTNFAVKVPAEAEVWRLPVFYGYWSSGTERLRNEIRYNLRVNWILLKHRDFPKWSRVPEVYIYSIYSPEVTNAEPIKAANSDVPPH